MNKRTIKNILENFAEPAKNKLNELVLKYNNELIKKSYDIKCEESEREDNLITMTHVLRAEQVLRLKKRKKNYALIILNYIVDILSIVVGLLFNTEKFQNDINSLIFFLIVGLMWSVLLVIKHSKEVA